MPKNWPGTMYACLNRGEVYVPGEPKSESICVNGLP